MNPMILLSVLVVVGLTLLYYGVVRFTRNTRPRWGECVVLVAMGLVLLWILIPTFNAARSKADTAACYYDLKQLAAVLNMYAQDHKEYLPPADRWMDVVTPYMKPDPTLFRCPAQGRDVRYSYALNVNLSARSLSEIPYPAETILLFESNLNVRNAAGTRKDLGGVYRRGEYRLFGMGWVRVEPEKIPETATPHLGGGNFAFVDGFVRWLPFDSPKVKKGGMWGVEMGGTAGWEPNRSPGE